GIETILSLVDHWIPLTVASLAAAAILNHVDVTTAGPKSAQRGLALSPVWGSNQNDGGLPRRVGHDRVVHQIDTVTHRNFDAGVVPDFERRLAQLGVRRKRIDEEADQAFVHRPK